MNASKLLKIMENWSGRQDLNLRPPAPHIEPQTCNKLLIQKENNPKTTKAKSGNLCPYGSIAYLIVLLIFTPFLRRGAQ